MLHCTASYHFHICFPSHFHACVCSFTFVCFPSWFLGALVYDNFYLCLPGHFLYICVVFLLTFTFACFSSFFFLIKCICLLTFTCVWISFPYFVDFNINLFLAFYIYSTSPVLLLFPIQPGCLCSFKLFIVIFNAPPLPSYYFYVIQASLQLLS